MHPKSYDLSSLRILGSVGEPINPAAWEWYHQHVGGGRCPIVDTFWQTETGGHMITPLPGATPLVPGSCTLPFPGITAAIVDETGNDVPNGQGGILVVKKPWPSMIRTIYGDPERFKKSYYPPELKGYYLAGDGAIRDAKTGYFTITGRIDDVLNVVGPPHGHDGDRVGPGRAAPNWWPRPPWSAAPTTPPARRSAPSSCSSARGPTGDEAKAIAKQLRDWVGQEIGPIAKPKDIRFGDNLPKTRSGKIMRRLLRSIAKGEAITQDTSTLENPAILEQLGAGQLMRPPPGAVARRLLDRQRPHRQCLASAGLTCGLAGIGDCAPHAGAALHDLRRQLVDGIRLAGVLGRHVLVGRADDLLVDGGQAMQRLLLREIGTCERRRGRAPGARPASGCTCTRRRAASGWPSARRSRPDKCSGWSAGPVWPVLRTCISSSWPARPPTRTAGCRCPSATLHRPTSSCVARGPTPRCRTDSASPP